jgi:hypothetical protein
MTNADNYCTVRVHITQFGRLRTMTCFLLSGSTDAMPPNDSEPSPPGLTRLRISVDGWMD